MSYFNNLVLTTKGQEMLLSSNTNIDKIITFTNASLGSEKLLPEEIKKATEVKKSWIKIPLNTVRVINEENNYFLRTEIAFTNAGITENKIMRELGIYAKFESEDEILFAYSVTDDDGETIPKEDIVPATYKFTIDATISTETKINQIISPDGFLTKEVIELLKENIRNIGFRKIKGTLNAGQKIIQVPLGAELIPISERAILNIEGEIYFLDRDYTIDTRANTITLKEPYSFNNESMYEIIDPLPPTYVKEQIQEFIDDFKQLVSDSKVDFEALKERVFLEIQQKVDDFYTQLENYIEENKENLKGHSIDRIIENGQDENGGNIYDIFRDDDRKIGTITAPKGDEGVGIDEPEYVGLTENGDTRYRWRKTDGTLTEKETIIPKGQKGNSFYIKKFYPSIELMEADFSNEEVGIGEYVIISSNDDDNGKLFEKRMDSFYFIVKMSGERYTLPIATKTILGGIKIGANMQITPEGVLNPKYPIASKNGKGIVQIGDGIEIDSNGVISVDSTGNSIIQQDNVNSKMSISNMTKEKFEILGYASTIIGICNDKALDTGSYNTSIGAEALESNINGNYNVAIGPKSLHSNNSGACNIAIGTYSLLGNRAGSYNVGIGINALTSLYSGGSNTAIGVDALRYLKEGSRNTAVGYLSGYNSNSFNNTSCFGYNSKVTGDNQVQLGDSYTTTFCYGAIQNRSDERDKTDIKDTSLGLEFLMKLRPREYRWDYRESYIDNDSLYEEIEIINNDESLSIEEKEIKVKQITDRYSIENVKKDGSKKGWRFHQGFIAQEVFQVMRELGVDFGGYQDHSINGGKDVLSIGYNEFIPVLVKGIQEQQKQIQELSNEIKKIKAELNKEKV